MLVDLIRDAVSGFEDFRSKKARSQGILELLCIYFFLLDVATEARALLDAVGSNPRATIDRLPEASRATTLSEWRGAISRQASRLSALSGRILGQDALAVFDPQLKARLENIVGSKFNRVTTLHGIGAALVWYSMLGNPTDRTWTREVILSMYPTRTRVTIDTKAARRELHALSAAIEDFRVVCTELATKNEILSISRQARRLTKYPGQK